MIEDNYKLKYIKYKKKYIELKKIQNNLDVIEKKILILPNEFNMLKNESKKKFDIYEVDKLSNPISFIKKDYLTGGDYDKNIINYDDENNIMKKNIIMPDEYYLLSDVNKSKYEINDYDYNKFPNRVVPKNYKKIKNDVL